MLIQSDRYQIIQLKNKRIRMINNQITYQSLVNFVNKWNNFKKLLKRKTKKHCINLRLKIHIIKKYAKMITMW
jgi:hypothetical protein